MSFTYCKLCGHKNLYSVNVPKFCGGCGAPLDGSPVSAAKQVLREKPAGRAKRTRPMEDSGASDSGASESEGTDIDYVPQIENLKCEILGLDSMARVMKIEDLISETEKEPSGEKTKRKPGRPRKNKRK